MEGFFVALLVMLALGILALSIIFMIRVSSQVGKIFKSITELKTDLIKIKTLINSIKEVKPSEQVIPMAKEQVIAPVQEIIKQHEVVSVPPVFKKEEPVAQNVTAIPVKPVVNQIKPKVIKATIPKTDLEKWIGEHVLSIIGIGVLVLGLAFFVKYAIDKNWINEVGRVAIGILAGGTLIALAHKLRKTYKTFSSILVGGGIAVLYFTISIGFQYYHLFSQTAAFSIMVVITAFAVLLSHVYNRQILAILAIVGGFGTPFFVSTGEGNYIVLFTYITILNVGMLVLSYFKNWYWLNVICFVFTTIIYGSWLGYQVGEKPQTPYLGALIYASIFYGIFFLMNIVNNIKEKRKFNWSEITILLTNTFMFFVAGMVILNNVHNARLQGIFTISIALFNLIFASLLYKRKQVDRNLIYLLIGFVLTFLSLTAPIQLDGNYITLFWAAETVLLLWFSQKSGIKIVKLASIILMPLMIISLIIDWSNLYVYFNKTFTEADAAFYGVEMVKPLSLIFNQAFITSIAVIISLYVNLFLLKYELKTPKYIENGVKVYRWILLPLFILFLYLGILLELKYQLWLNIDYSFVRNVYLGVYHFSFVLGLILWANYRKEEFVKNIVIGIGFFVVICYLVFFNHQTSYVRDLYISGGPISLTPFMFHYLSTLFVITISFLIWRSYSKLYSEKSVLSILSLWFTVFVFIFVGSSELDHLTVLTQVDANNSIQAMLLQSRKISYPIFWGITSFTLMFIGMKSKNQMFRIISLSVFAITLIKLFTWDIIGINEAGKITAFISLGILLLVVSFMYQKLKRLILEDDIKNKQNDITKG